MRKKKMIINVKNCQPSKCFITYTLSYNRYQDGKKTDKFEVKKIAELTSPEPGVWKIASVSTIKSHIEGKSISISPY